MKGENLAARVQEAQRILATGDQTEAIAYLLDRPVEDVRRVAPVSPSPADPGPVDEALDRLDEIKVALTTKVSAPMVASAVRSVDEVRQEIERLREERDAWRRHAQTSDREVTDLRETIRLCQPAWQVQDGEFAAVISDMGRAACQDVLIPFIRRLKALARFQASATPNREAHPSGDRPQAQAGSPAEERKCPKCGHELHGYRGPLCRYCTPGEYWE